MITAVQASPIHGLGVFAREIIRCSSRVLPYHGELISKNESLQRQESGNWFLFYFDEEHDLDGNVEWNPSRFVNHSCAPNCEAIKIGGEVWLVALRDISAGEEITFNYGFGPEEFRAHPCKCGAMNCVGYILGEEFWAMARSSRPA